jgi:hypothetical protein
MLLRRPLPALLFLGSSILVAVAFAAGMREVLPYEALRRYTPEAQFLLWEGAVWTMGLVLLFVSAAILIENLPRLLRGWKGRSDSGDLPVTPRGFLLAPWWMLATGAALVVLGIGARAQLGG